MSRLSRAPLSADEINTLIQAAIQLHTSALSNKQDSRWWISGVIGLAGVIVGTLLSFHF